MKNNFLRYVALILLAVFSLSSCTVVRVVDAAASTTVGAIKTTGKVVGAAIPDGDKDKKDD